MIATIDTWTGRLGLLAGLVAATSWVAMTGRPAEAPAPPAASVRLGAASSAELDVSPRAKPVLAGEQLRPGGPAERGSARLRNQTPSALRVAVRISSERRELDRTAWIQVVAGGRTLVRGPIAGAHSWSGATRVAPGESRRLRVRVWIPEDAADGWQAARGSLALQFRSQVVGSR